jgi:NCS1 family nucleobase:cation symporter-1
MHFQVPWKITGSAEQLINFMAAMSIFLAPIAAILASDFWLVKKHAVDVPSLYRPHARYAYTKGVNWRAAVALVVSVAPNMPGMINAVNPKIDIGGASYIYDVNYFWGFTSAAVLYTALSWLFPARETLIEHAIHDDMDEFEKGSSGDVDEVVISHVGH